MKRGTPNHPKTHHLTELLGIEPWGSVGILESLWHFGATYAPRGDIGRHTDVAIERAIGWRGTPGALVAALQAARWVDPCCSEHRLRIHDWPDHADQTVKRGTIVGGIPADPKKGRAAVPGQGFIECFRPGKLVAKGTLAADQSPASVPPVNTGGTLAGDSSGTLSDASLPLPLSVAVAVAFEPEPLARAVPASEPPADPRADDPPPLPHDIEPPARKAEPLMAGRRGASEVEWLRLVDWIAKRTGKPPEEVPPLPPGEGARVLNPADRWVTDARLMRDLIDLRKIKASLEAEAAATATPGAEAARARTRADELYDRRHELASEFLAWFRLHPEAGEADGRVGLVGQAFGAWPGGKGFPADIRHAIAQVAYRLHAAAPAPEPVDKSSPHAPTFAQGLRRKGDRAPLCDVCERVADDPIHQRKAASLDLFRAAGGGA